MTQLQCKHGFIETTSDQSRMSESLRLYGEWSERQICVIQRFMPPDSVVADIGASVGAHALAFARTINDAGHVHAFESRSECVALLRKNIASNFLQEYITVQRAGSMAGVSADSEVGAAAALLESLNLSRLDVVNVALGETAAEIFRHAPTTVGSCRPVGVARFDSSEGVADVLASLHSNRYVAVGYADYAFNPENYRRCSDNMFGEEQEAMLILIPAEKAKQFDLSNLRSINSVEDALALLPAQFRGVLGTASATSNPAVEPVRSPRPLTHRNAAHASLRETWVSSSDDASANIYDERCRGKEMHVVVPFYKKEELVPQIFGSLNAIADELREIGAKVFFYNDSPDYAPLQAALEECRFSDAEVEFKVIRNATNLGFIGTCNNAFAIAKQARADVILLNSDTMVFAGALREMLQVAQVDPMIGFVSPRSNNATLATLPHSSLDREVTPQAGYAAFVKNSATLPRFSYVPTAVGFCLFVKWSVHSELGAFDPIYAAGYNEENDLIMRANRCGYRAVLANQAFVWHQGEQSFAESARSKASREAKNAPILQSRYPEYLPLIHAYFSSPEFRAEDLLEYVDGKNGQLTIAFDFSSFGPFFNGTFESGIKLLDAAGRNWPKHCTIAVYMDPVAWKFHGLERLAGVRRLDVNDPAAKVTAIVRIGQPFDVNAVSRIISRAPVVGIFMLDTISYDCGYLSLTFDHRIWHYVFGYVDVLFTNSRFTLERISNRFKLGRNVLRRISLHSLDASEYAQPRDRTAGGKPHIFVIGNHFSHKFVRPTVDAVAEAFPDRKVIAVGYGDEPSSFSNIEAYQSGNLSDETFEKFYSDAEAVIFPSHYEGFGFPILHSLARKRPIYVRDSALYRELAGSIQGANNIHYFCTTADLVTDLRENGMQWVAAETQGEKGGWDRSAREVFQALEQARRTVSYDALVSRLRQLDQIMLATSAFATVPNPIRRVGMKVEAIVERVLRVPGVKPVARRGWRVVRRLRAKR